MTRSFADTHADGFHPVHSRFRLGSHALVPALALVALLAANAPSVAATEADAVIREACGDDPAAACVAELRKVCSRKMTMRCYFSRKERIDVKRADRAGEDDVVDAFGKVGTDYDE